MERDPEQETAFRWGMFTGLRYGFALGLVVGAAAARLYWGPGF